MIAHPSSQFFRFLKAYSNINNKSLINISDTHQFVWLDQLKDNPNIVISDEKDNNILLKLSKPQEKDFPKIPNVLIEHLETITDTSLSHENLIDIFNNINLLDNEVSLFLDNRESYVKKINEYNNAELNFNSLNKIYYTFRNCSNDYTIFMGNGLLSLKQGSSDISFPLIHQPIKLIKEHNSFIIYSEGKPFLCTDTLTMIPGVSGSAIERCIDEFSKYTGNLPGSNDLNITLSNIFKNITFGSSNLLSLSYSPAIFINSITKNLSKIINDFQRKKKTIPTKSSLDYFFEYPKRRVNVTTSDDEYITYVQSHDLSNEIINKVNSFNVCLVNTPPGTNSYITMSSLLEFYLSKNFNILVVEPSERHKHTTINKLPKHLTIQKKSNVVSNDLSNEYNKKNEYYNELNKVFNNLKKYTASSELIDSEVYTDSRFWNDDVVYERGLLTDLYNTIDNVLPLYFSNNTFTKEIANQCKVYNLHKKWTSLMNVSSDYVKYVTNIADSLMGKKISLNKVQSIKSMIKTVNEILESINKKNKLSIIDYTFSRSWREFINSTSINNNKPKSLSDFVLLKLYLEKILCKHKLKELWNELVVPLGLLKLPSSDNEIILELDKISDLITSSMSWYDTVWLKFIEDLKRTGFRWNDFFGQFGQYYIENDLIQTLQEVLLPQLKDLINNRINYTKENLLLYESSFEATNFFNVDDTLIDLDYALGEYNKICNNLKMAGQYSFNTELNSNLTICSYTDFISNHSIYSENDYDLLIVNNSQNINFYGSLLLSLASNAIIFGDGQQYHEEKQLSDIDTITELSKSLLSGITNVGSIISSHNLYDFIESYWIPTVQLSYNTGNSLSVVNCLNNLSYDNLKYLGNTYDNTILSLDIGYLDSNYSLLQDYVYSLIVEVRNNIDNDHTILFVDLSEKYYVDLSKKIYDSNVSNTYVHNITGLDGKTYDYVFVLDLISNESTNIKYEQIIKSEFNTLLGTSKYFFCYLYSNTNNNILLPIQHNLIEFIDFSNIFDNYKSTHQLLLLDIEKELSKKEIRCEKNLVINSLEVDLLIYADKPTLIIDKKKIISVDYNILDLFINMNLYNNRIVLVDFNKEYLNLKDEIVKNIDSRDESSLNLKAIKEFIINYHNSNCTKDKPHANTLKEVAVTNDFIFEDKNIDLSNNQFIKGDIVESFSDNNSFSFTDDGLNNKAALHNFSNDIDSIYSNDVKQVNDMLSTDKTLIEIPNNEISDAFIPEQDTYDNLFIDVDSTIVSDNNILPKVDFNLIEWLKDNHIEFYDYRPNGNLCIKDSSNIRKKLRKLRIKGYHFTLSLNNTEVPMKQNVWILKK